jgi:hypothetical protein
MCVWYRKHQLSTFNKPKGLICVCMVTQTERDTLRPRTLKGLFLFPIMYLFLITSQATCHTEPLYLCQHVPVEKQLGTLNDAVGTLKDRYIRKVPLPRDSTDPVR